MNPLTFFLLAFIFLLPSCNSKKIENKETTPIVETRNQQEEGGGLFDIPFYTIKVIRTIPHDTDAFTQGLLFHNGKLYESTGQYGHSSLRQINPFDGKIERIVKIEPQYFCEGIALFENKIFLLTWQNNVCFVFNINTFQKVSEYYLAGEGWGLTNYDERTLIQSDGTNILKILDPNNFNILKTISVFAGTYPLSNLNELENIEGEIWANIWMSDTIAVIDRTTGKVKYFIDASSLRQYIPPGANIDVLNGIAYDKKSKSIYLTGKLWPYIFQVEIVQNK